MTFRKTNPYLNIVNSYLIDSPQPSSINYWWNLGSLLGLCLVIQIASGIFLAMHVRRWGSCVNPGKVGYYFVHIIKSPNLGTLGNQVLNLACWEKVQYLSKLLGGSVSDEISNIWLKLDCLKINFQSSQAGDLCLDSYGANYSRDSVGVHDTVRTTSLRYINNINIKEMSDQPKEINILNTRETTVSTKDSNIYVEGETYKSVLYSLTQPSWTKGMKYNDRNVSWNISTRNIQKSVSVVNSIRFYSTGSGKNLKVLEKLNDLSKFSKNYPDRTIDRKLYNSFILNKDLYLFAYNNLKSKPGMMTPGINPTTLDGMFNEILDDSIERLRSGTFNFTPAKRIEIDKLSDGKRPLSTPLDKLVQEVIRLVLEAIYEPIFFNISYGFRPKKSTHSALRYVFTQFRGCTWWIKGDIQKCFDSIPHDKLIALLSDKIEDKRFIALINKALKAGYMLDREVKFDIVGTPQGSIISPILANIYLHQLDTFILDLKAKFDSNIKSRSQYNRNSAYRSIESKLGTARKNDADKSTLRNLSRKLRNTPIRFKSEVDNKLMYVRYADNWIVAINGSHDAAVKFKNLISDYCYNELGITLSESKTKITNSYLDHILFLGTNIKHSTRRDVVKARGHLIRSPGFLMLTAPMSRIAKKLHLAKFQRDHKGLTKAVWLSLELPQIIHLANSVINGYLNYYSFVYNRNRLTGYIFYIIRDCVLRTIAAKMRLKTRAQVTKKYGSQVSVKVYNKDGSVLKTVSLKNVSKLYRMNLWDFKADVSNNLPSLFATNVSMASILGSVCSVCSSEYRVEMHHVRKLNNLKLDRSDLNYLMSKRRRKQIALCRSCHMKHHNGTLTIPKHIMDKYTNSK